MSRALCTGWMAAAIVLTAVGVAAAGGKGSCCHCQCCPPTKKVCRWVPEKKTIEIEKWDCECETICIPGRSKHCGESCTVDCHCKKHIVHHWSPSCAKPRTINKLKKIKEKKEVCTWKWVVEEVCDQCAGKCSQCAPACSEAAPVNVPAPVVDASALPSGRDERAPPLPFPAPPIPEVDL